MAFSFLWSWWRGRPGRVEHLRFVIYTRQGCHLCEVAEQRLRGEQRRWGFRLETVDVDGDERLAERYGLEVPVITVNDKVRFRGAVNPVLLRRLLEAEARNPKTYET